MSLRGHLLLREERHPAGLQCRCGAAPPGDVSMHPAILSHRAGWFVFVRLLVSSETCLWPGRPLTPRPFWFSACQWKWSRVPPRSHCDGQQELSKHIRVKKNLWLRCQLETLTIKRKWNATTTAKHGSHCQDLEIHRYHLKEVEARITITKFQPGQLLYASKLHDTGRLWCINTRSE